METADNLDWSFDPEIIHDLNDPRLFINRELSLLAFQKRVLEEAEDAENPLLERVKFLAIVSLNLDEFFMIRVAGLRQQISAGVVEIPPDGLTPTEQLAAIREKASQLMADMRTCWLGDLLPQLNKAGIHVTDYKLLNKQHRTKVDRYFEELVFPVLTPIALDPGRPFPHISNLSLNLAVLIRDDEGQEHFARIKVPDTLPRLVPISARINGTRRGGQVSRRYDFVWLEQLIAANLNMLFPDLQVIESHPFRVTRDADMVIQELEADDLLETMEESVRRRRFGSVVRVAVNDEMPQHIQKILLGNLHLDQEDLYPLHGAMGYSALMDLYNIDRYDLKYAPFLPAVPKPLNQRHKENVFSAIRRNSILLHHPYDSFMPVIDFLNAAAKDPDVLAIKQTLYRVGRNSPVVDALLKARENGKQVSVLVELKARFDEESNIEWARTLEHEGVHVIYGLLGIKTHSKIALVVRKEGGRIRRYIHMGTGNYNVVTGHQYTDLGYFTCDEDIGADATDFLNYLTGYSGKKNYRKLMVAPVNLRAEFEALIQREIASQQKNGQGHVIFKMNALVDKQIIQSLYQASQAGVKVDLIVRSICCLRPGIPGLSDNIRVISVVGRFLEHSRIYYFQNGGHEEIYLSSADLMPRNIDRRVEVMFPVEDAKQIRYIRDDVLAIYLADNTKTRRLLPNGEYEYVPADPKENSLNIQSWLLNFHGQLSEE